MDGGYLFYLLPAVLIGALGLLYYTRKASYALHKLGIQNRSALKEKLLKKPYTFTEEIVQKCSSDAIASLVVKLLGCEESLALAQFLVTEEVRKSTEATMLRGNTAATRIMSAFAKRASSKYLKTTLGPCIQDLVDQNEDLEVFPTRMNVPGDLEPHKNRLEAIFQEFFDQITNSTENIPISMRILTHHLWKETSAKNPSLGANTIGSYFFLRLICPSIVMAYQNGIIKEKPGKHAERSLVIIAKMLQQVANNLPFQQKEAELMIFNPIILKNKSQFNEFITNISEEPPKRRVEDEIEKEKDLEEAYQSLEKEILNLYK